MTPTESSSRIRLIASDIDGTLLDNRHQLSPRNKAALRAAIDAGVQVVLATGKTRSAGAFITDQLNLNSHGIFMQGLIVYDAEGAILYQQTLDPEATRQLIAYAEARGFAMVAYTSSRIIIHERDRKLIEGIGRYHEPDPDVVDSLQELVAATPLNKIMIIGEPNAITTLRGELAEVFGASLRVVQAGIPEMLEVLPPNGSKGDGLRVLLDVLNIPAEQVMALGDGENDIEMLELAGIGVAVDNATPLLKAVANYVVASNEADGAAEAIERFVLHRAVNVPPGDAPLPTPDEPAPQTRESEPSVSTSTAHSISETLQ